MNLVLEAVQRVAQQLAGGSPPIVGILVRAEVLGAASEAARRVDEAWPYSVVSPSLVFTHPRYREEQATVFYDRDVMNKYLEKLDDSDSED